MSILVLATLAITTLFLADV